MPRIASTTRTTIRATNAKPLMDTDFAYDFPTTSTSPQPPTYLSPPSPPHKSRRLPHSPQGMARYSPASRQAELSRLLDPAYAPSTSSTSPVDAYVDHRGDLHDPDYVHFPAVRVRAPHPWDVPYAPDDQDDDQDDIADDVLPPFSTYTTRDPFYAKRPRGMTASTTTSSTTSSWHHRESIHRAFPPIPMPHATAFTYSPPTSFDSDDTVLVAHEDESPFVDREKEQTRWLCPVTRYTSRRKSKEEERPPISEKPEEESEDPSGRPEEDPSGRPEDLDLETEWTPTCSESIRRQWQSISLRFRLGLFRAKRRARRRLSTT